jgi:hypothetical protein
MKGPQFGIRKAQGDSGVDLEALRAKLDKMHSIPQLKAGLNGKLQVVVPEPKAATTEQEHEMGIKALAQCVAQAEGDWIYATLRKIFREDGIGMCLTRRMREFRTGDLEPMRTLLSELEISINHREPEEGYELPADCILYRRLEITKGGKVRAENIWEWSRQK